MKPDHPSHPSFSAYMEAHGDFVHAFDMPVKSEVFTQKYHVNTFQDGSIESFSDMYNFGRVVVGRNSLYRQKSLHSVNPHNPMMFGINICLSGNMSIHFEALDKRIAIKPSQAWLRKGQLGTMQGFLPDHTHLRGISIDFDDTLLTQLTDDHSLGKAAQFFLRGKDTPEVEALDTPSPMMLLMAEQLLTLPCASNDLDLMRLESAALGLLARILQERTLPSPEKGSARYVSIVRHILKTELGEHHTIRQLARLAGINECTLKKEFKTATGLTIAHYARKCKMDAALELLTQGIRPADIAQHLGYCNTSHFSRVFLQHFGYPPKVLN